MLAWIFFLVLLFCYILIGDTADVAVDVAGTGGVAIAVVVTGADGVVVLICHFCCCSRSSLVSCCGCCGCGCGCGCG